MAYNYYPATYQAPVIYSQAPPQSTGIQWVQGEIGARAFPVSPGASVLLMDSDENRFFIKSADASGMPLPLRMFSYTEEVATQSHENKPIDTSNFVTREEFEQWKSNQKRRHNEQHS